MRIKLTPEGDQALGFILERAFKQNPFIEKDNNRLISAIVVGFERHLQPRQMDELVQALSTPKSVRMALMREMETLSQDLDSDGLRGLEVTMRKLRSQAQHSKKHEENGSG